MQKKLFCSKRYTCKFIPFLISRFANFKFYSHGITALKNKSLLKVRLRLNNVYDYQNLMVTKIDQESKDCLACRLVTGIGVVGIGTYIYAQAKNRRRFEIHAMRLLAAGTIGIGIARLLNMDFLKAKRDK